MDKLEQLRRLAEWLVEESDLPATEAADFAVVLDWAIRELEGANGTDAV